MASLQCGLGLSQRLKPHTRDYINLGHGQQIIKYTILLAFYANLSKGHSLAMSGLA